MGLDSPASGGAVDAALLSDLVAASHILAAQGVVDGFGHVSMRHPTAPQRYVMARALAPSLVQPHDLIEYDLDSRPCNANGRTSFLERFIHSEIYKARPDVQAVVHAHPKWSTFLTMTGHDYLPVFAQGSLLYPLPVLDSPNSINNPVMAERLAATLGDRPGALMKSHGAVAVGQSIVEAFVLANYMEENAQRQYMALQIGKPYVFSAAEIAMCREKLFNAALFQRTWDHFHAKLKP
jgi:ribulose-5-phosphate 4-epimerase/fuculose-1-phosphate aldolase